MKIFARRKLEFEYNILSRYQAGMALRGDQIKIMRQKKIGMIGSFVILQPLYIKNIKLDGNMTTIDLLLRRTEIRKLYGLMSNRSNILIPESVIEVRGKLKLNLVLCNKASKHDKREKIKERDQRRKSEL